MFFGQSYAKYDKNMFQETLNDHDWSTSFKSTSPDECWDHIGNQITAALDSMCPLRKRLIKDTSEPWQSHEIIELLHDKDRAWKKARKSHSEADLVKAKQLRNQAKTVVRRAKANHIQEEIDRNKDDRKTFWEKIAMLLPSKNKTSPFLLVDHSTNCEIPPKETANHINTFFANISPSLASKFVMPCSFDGKVPEVKCSQ